LLVLLSEILDEAEFGEAAANTEYDENTINPASDLGLMVGYQIECLDNVAYLLEQHI
jgi:hypothetical protein